MKYYILEYIPEEIGQVEEIDNTNYDRLGYGGYSQIPLEGPVPPNTTLPPGILAERYQPTDFLNVVPFGNMFLIVSPKVNKLLNEFNLDYCKFLDFEVLDRRMNIRYKYYGLHFHWFRNELYLNWERTVFRVKEKGFYPRGEIKFENYLEYRQWRIENFGVQTAHLEQMIFKDDVKKKDFFMLNNISRIYIASERIREAFELHKITGIKFRPIVDD